jgi:DNA-binding winged helix-turn-helix (wHTH) protein/tetratricopeptide (TPR) repeat protein
MSVQIKQFYGFGPFRLDAAKRVLLRDGSPVPLTPKATEMLLVLVENAGQLLDKDELMKRVWPDAFVEEGNLNKNIFLLRKVLGVWDGGREYIETVPKRGYRFVAPVNEVTHAEVRYQPQASAARPPEGEDAPTRLEKQSGRPWNLLVPAAVLLIAVLAGGGWYSRSRQSKKPGKVTVVLADFVNNTSDPVLEDALRQALLTSLDQSPFLNILSDDKVREQLEYMGRPAIDRLTEPVAREVCQRAGATAVLVGSISSLGAHYALDLSAVNCQTGESVSRQEAEVESREKILQAVGRISTKTRETLGESLSSIQKYDVPLDQATTSSLEALRLFRLGLKADDTQGSAASRPFFKQAIELDQGFAEAYEALGISYCNFGEWELAEKYETRALELSNRASEREKLDISATYYGYATHELDKAISAHQLWEKTYPGDRYASMNLGDAYLKAGQYEQCAAASRRSIGIDANASVPYGNLAICLVNLDRLDAAAKVVDDAFSRKLDDFFTRQARYVIAFLQGDELEMQNQLVWAAGRPGEEEAIFLAYQVDTEASHGRLTKSYEYSRRAVDSELRADSKEGAASQQAYAALWQAEFGNLVKARKDAASALTLSPGRDGKLVVAMALARIGDVSRANAVSDDVLKAYPKDTLLQFYSLPSIRAAAELSRGDAAKAEDFTEHARPYELGSPTDLRPLYPIYVRGQAYLAMHRGNDAAVEFQRILDHRGLNGNSPLGALAHLQIGRAYAMSGNPAKARAAYQDFLTLWKDADAGIPILKQAKAEYAKLQ